MARNSDSELYGKKIDKIDVLTSAQRRVTLDVRFDMQTKIFAVKVGTNWITAEDIKILKKQAREALDALDQITYSLYIEIDLSGTRRTKGRGSAWTHGTTDEHDDVTGIELCWTIVERSDQEFFDSAGGRRVGYHLERQMTRQASGALTPDTVEFGRDTWSGDNRIPYTPEAAIALASISEGINELWRRLNALMGEKRLKEGTDDSRGAVAAQLAAMGATGLLQLPAAPLRVDVLDDDEED